MSEEVWLPHGSASPHGEGDGSRPGCPDAETLACYIDGVLDGTARRSVEDHLASCRSCRDVVVDAAAQVAAVEGVSAEEGSIPQPSAARSPWFRRVAPALATAALLVLAVGGAMWAGLVPGADARSLLEVLGLATSTERLIAQGYSARRTMEVRLVESDYAAMRTERGAAADALTSSASLLEADARISRALETNGESIALAHRKAQIELIQWQYATALQRLQRVADAQPDNLDAKRDLAVGYYQRALTESRSIDLSTALELLSEVLSARPGDRIALFNRIVVEDQLFLYSEAIADGESYLALEPSGGWSNEIRERLSRLRAAQGRARAPQRCEDLAASDVARWSPGSAVESMESFDGSMECLRQRALVAWYPQLTVKGAESAAYSVAAEAFKRLGDSFLEDLRLSTGPSQNMAASELAEAIDANLRVETARAEPAALSASRTFHRAGNGPGETQALIEFSYAIRRSQRGSECLILSTDLADRLAMTSWTWTALESRLELATCVAMTGDRGKALRLAEGVVADSVAPGFGSINSRAHSYVQSYHAAIGDYEAAWRTGTDGLRTHFSRKDRAVWAYQIYFGLSTAAAAMQEPHVVLRYKRAALEQIRQADRPLIEALSWFELGRAAMAVDAQEEAERAFRQASDIFGSLPDSGALQATLTDTEISLAEIETRRGDRRAALGRLESVRRHVASTQSFPVRQRFLMAVVRAAVSEGLVDRYSSDLSALAEITEEGYRGLTTFEQRADWTRRSEDTARVLAGVWATQKGNPTEALEAWESHRGAPAAFGPHASAAGPAARTAGAQQSVPERLAEAGIPDALIYVSFEDRLLIWRVAHRKVSLAEVPVQRAVLKRLVDRLRMLTASPESSETAIDGTVRELRKYLVAPVSAAYAATNETLWVELDTWLQGVPLALLQSVDAAAVVDGRPIAMFPAAAFVRAGPAKRSEVEGKPLVVGISTLRSSGTMGLPPLPDATEEARFVASSRGTTCLTDGDATKSRLLADLPRASLFHFAGHSWNTATRPALLVAPEPGSVGDAVRLEARDIAALDLRACALAVLSACSVQAPDVTAPGTAPEFIQALLGAGVKGVLATRWSLNSKVALQFTRSFYQELDRGADGAHAAALAVAAIRREPATRHPYFWAGYQFYGR